MRLVLDIQGYKIEKEKFIVKELASYDGKRLSHYVFKPPFNKKLLSHNFYKRITETNHCIDWSSGFTPVHHFKSIVDDLTKEANMVYINGKENYKIIKKICKIPVYEFNENLPLDLCKPKCFYHSTDNCICSLSNVFYIYDNYIMNENEKIIYNLV